jgi:cytochrome oxidase Cu insertion factor (SCO1/SenC/PrrC family)
MKRAPILLSVLVLLVLTITPIATFAAGNLLNDAGFIKLEGELPAKNFILDDLEDQQVSLRYFRGKVVLLFFWTTW